MKILTIASAKGGVGKTTVTENLAMALARQTGRTVLAVDLDPQNALALHLGLGPQELRGLSRASQSGQNWRDACFERQPRLYLLPIGAGEARELVSSPRRFHDGGDHRIRRDRGGER